ncbi:osteopontin isoform X2 [Serinus canaria]|uniref:osteopontin isoform X2 n=1 Tax=Serinus canaria TaxID=9135 RepID=UPI0008DB8040|nr:osteopontin isoform X2 [Serinus canaria]
MKETVLCLCLISITAAWPVIQSKQPVISASSKEKYDSRGHHLHRYHNDYVNSQSWESQQHPQSDLASSQQTLYSSEESVDVPEQLGNNAGRGDSVAYRMRAKAALLKSIKLHKATKKLIYDATQEDESDMDADSQRSVSREDSASRRSLRKHASSMVWSDQSHGRDSSEQDSDPHYRSLENDSRPDSHEAEGDSSESGIRGDSHSSVESREKGDSLSSVESRERGDSLSSVESREKGDSLSSVESREKGDSLSSVESREKGDSLSSVESRERGDSHPSVESRESRDRVSAELSDDIITQTLENAEDSQDRHSIESNEVTL